MYILLSANSRGNPFKRAGVRATAIRLDQPPTRSRNVLIQSSSIELRAYEPDLDHSRNQLLRSGGCQVAYDEDRGSKSSRLSSTSCKNLLVRKMTQSLREP